eukprot:jgi/Tetstr1/435348/TSEL_024266.t1
MVNQLPTAYDGVPTEFSRYLIRRLIARGCTHLKPGWVPTRSTDTSNMYASLDKKQTWPRILAVGAGLRGWKFVLIDAPDDTRFSEKGMFSEVDRIWLAVARPQLDRAMEVCIEKDPQWNPKLREAFIRRPVQAAHGNGARGYGAAVPLHAVD